MWTSLKTFVTLSIATLGLGMVDGAVIKRDANRALLIPDGAASCFLSLDEGSSFAGLSFSYDFAEAGPKNIVKTAAFVGGYNNGYPANPSIRAEVFAQDSGNSIHLAGSGPDGSYIQGYEEKSPPTAGRVRLSPQGTLFINQKNDVFDNPVSSGKLSNVPSGPLNTVFLGGYGLNYAPASDKIRFEDFQVILTAPSKKSLELVCSSNGGGGMYRYAMESNDAVIWTTKGGVVELQQLKPNH